MEPAEREADPYFSQPIRQIFLTIVVLGLVGFGGYIVYPSVASVFTANLYLNGAILGVFVFGILACFWQLVQLVFSVNWIVGFTDGDEDKTPSNAPRLLASLATLMRRRDRRMQISAASSRSILDSVATRIDEIRDITRYVVNLLIFLGLLGTFYGLATTVPAVVDTIRSLAPNENETGIAVFNRLMTGLETQLGGMGVAFSSSLIGLAGSLVVGLLELFASHGQNRFYRELEEWLSSITRLGFSSGDGETSAEQDAVVAVLEHMDQQMEGMRAMFVQSDQGRKALDERLTVLTDSMTRMIEKMEHENATAGALSEIADSQSRLVEVLDNQTTQGSGGSVDAESRMRLRSIDVQLLRILEEMSAGRQETTINLRSDLAALTNAVRELTREAEAAGRG
ncbi:MAG: biopolymer transporter ExbB [Pseudomonadota bacterium]